MITVLAVGGVYISVAILMWLGPAFIPRFHRYLWDRFDGDAPFVPYSLLIGCWPILLPIYAVGYSIYGIGYMFDAIKLSSLDERIVEYMEKRKLAKIIEVKQLPEPQPIPVRELGYRDANCITCGRSMDKEEE